MTGNTEFITYCLEEFKAAKGKTGKGVYSIILGQKYSQYNINCSGSACCKDKN